MINQTDFELPSELQHKEKQAVKLEFITIAYLITVVILMYLVMGSSQAMKTAWIEDALSIIPAISFLIAVKNYNKPANNKFQYGYNRVFSIAFLTGSVALLGIGLFLVIDSSSALFNAERPTIGSVEIFGHQIWMGWIMIMVLIYSSIPAMILGFKKLPLAKKLHNKILYTDADTQKADYLTGFAAVGGIIGVGYGWWWADAVAALIISLSVAKDGFKNTKHAIFDLMDRIPEHVESGKPDELIEQISNNIKKLEWIKDSTVRFREVGQIYMGEVFVITINNSITTSQIAELNQYLKKLDWKLVDITIMLVNELPQRINR